MGTLHYLAKTRLRKMLRESAALITVFLRNEDVVVPDYCYKNVPWTVLAVGPQLKPAMNLRFDEDALRATITKGATLSNPGVSFEATVPWQAIIGMDRLAPPSGGDSPGDGEFVFTKAA